jgi:hypothetical protein
MPRGKGNRGGRKGRSHMKDTFKLDGRVLVTINVLSTYHWGYMIMTPDSANASYFGSNSGRLAALSDSYEYCRCVRLVIEVSPGLGEQTNLATPWALGWLPGIPNTAPVTAQAFMDMPWVSPWYGASSASTCLTNIVRNHIPRRVLLPPNLAWFRTRFTGAVDNLFETQGAFYLWLQTASVALGGDYVSFVLEYTYEFKDPINSSMTPSKNAGLFEKALLRHNLPDITEEKKEEDGSMPVFHDHASASSSGAVVKDDLFVWAITEPGQKTDSESSSPVDLNGAHTSNAIMDRSKTIKNDRGTVVGPPHTVGSK